MRNLGTVTPVQAGFEEPILHVDMDAFFVEVERRRDPALKARPVLVGGAGPRAVVASASYEARAFGAHSAMPVGEATRRCPQALVVPPDHREYRAASKRVFEVLRSFTPHVEGLSVDEAFLDITGLRLHYGSPAAVGSAIRSRIRRELDLPASVGGGASKLIAKLASEEAKPDGLLVVEAGRELAFLHPLPVERLWGVGEATLAGLAALGVSTVGDLAAVPATTLERRLGTSVGRQLSDLANGRDDRRVQTGGGAKSVSVEQTYDRDLDSIDEMQDELLALCDRLSARLNAAGVAARTVTLKLRYADFTTVTRSTTTGVPVDHTPDLWEAARSLFDKAVAGQTKPTVRLLGVGGSGLVGRDIPRQLSMDHPRRDAAARAAEAVRARFGPDAVVPARLADGGRRSDGSEVPDIPS